MVYQIFLNLIQWLTSFLWTSETTSTVELGKSTGTKEHDGYRKRIDKMSANYTNKKPPLAPKRKGRKRRQIPAVLYIDEDYWDARMADVDD